VPAIPLRTPAIAPTALNADGSYSYVANNGSLPSQIVPQDVFNYVATYGHGGEISSSTLTITILSPSQSYQTGSNTTLTGGNGKNVLDGTAGNDILLGGNGPDVLLGGPGDQLTGGNGPDVFVFNQHFGKNTITDFDVNNDAIQISKALFATPTDLLNHTTDSASGAIIAASATDQITLVGVTKAQLMAHQADFYFV
jgi:Ca2+-binding RTX toxin-like protein